MTTTNGDEELIQAIHDEQHEIEGMFDELDLDMASPEYRRQLVDHIIATLVRHITVKEQYLYPEVRHRVPDRSVLVDRMLDEHARADETMKELEHTSPSETRFNQLLGSLADRVRQGFDTERERMLPQLEAACGADHLNQLGAKMALAKDSAPTHPHPGAPDKPPSNLIIDPGIGIVDRIRDALTSSHVSGS
ncbi:Hemerythrin HHE cation binding domain-containing protein [Haloechinothrix alba]|uniref:Hemerythrin HHE cation binding domain-containing protein n=1 Tax=Haloechinothrix alba TaxID=664784 RepID=A0A238XAV6_9PSEU|nr:hemerythrin domain-containing protein [Haloechinothrix alba]SNR55850.1 Hemerythrin HHE cation binding domain-containing protein [Haloechinothrix alba]